MIIINESPDRSVSARDAQYLALVIHEVLRVVMQTEREFKADDPIVHIGVFPPGHREEAIDGYEVLVEDREFPLAEASTLAERLPMTSHLLETFGGSLSVESDAGLHLTGHFSFDASNTPPDRY